MAVSDIFFLFSIFGSLRVGFAPSPEVWRPTLGNSLSTDILGGYLFDMLYDAEWASAGEWSSADVQVCLDLADVDLSRLTTQAKEIGPVLTGGHDHPDECIKVIQYMSVFHGKCVLPPQCGNARLIETGHTWWGKDTAICHGDGSTSVRRPVVRVVPRHAYFSTFTPSGDKIHVTTLASFAFSQDSGGYTIYSPQCISLASNAGVGKHSFHGEDTMCIDLAILPSCVRHTAPTLYLALREMAFPFIVFGKYPCKNSVPSPSLRNRKDFVPSISQPRFERGHYWSVLSEEDTMLMYVIDGLVLLENDVTGPHYARFQLLDFPSETRCYAVNGVLHTIEDGIYNSWLVPLQNWLASIFSWSVFLQLANSVRDFVLSFISLELLITVIISNCLTFPTASLFIHLFLLLLEYFLYSEMKIILVFFWLLKLKVIYNFLLFCRVPTS